MNRASSKKLAIAACLTALGLAGNYLALPIAFSVQFIFGSVFSILAIGALGPWWGVGVAAAASSYTCILWNHPYALIIFTFEALWISCALRRKKTNIILIDLTFWLAAGWLLVAFFYGGVMGMNLQGTETVILKQTLNGLFNALVASILLAHTPFRKLTGGVPRTDYTQMIFHLVCTFLMVPSLFLLFNYSYREVVNLKQQTAALVGTETTIMAGDLAGWLEMNQKAAEMIARLGSDYGLRPSARLQEELEQIKSLFPDFHMVYLADGRGVTVGCFPPKNDSGASTIGLSFADRSYYKSLLDTGQPVISDIFTGRSVILQPIFTVSVPVLNNGKLSHFGLGGINLDRLLARLQSHSRQNGMIYTLLDGKGNVMLSTDKALKQMAKLKGRKPAQVSVVSPSVSLYLPGAVRNTSVMQVWQGAYFFSSTPVKGTPWTLQVEYPVAPLQKLLYASAITGLGTIALLLLLLISLASAISLRLTLPLLSLASISKHIPAKIEQNEEISWPGSVIGEVALLEEHFREAAEALRDKISKLDLRFSLAADSAGIGVWDWLVPENRLIWDKRMFALYGLHDENFAGAYQAWQDGLHPDDKEPGDRAIKQALHGEKEFDIEFRVVWPSGETRQIRAHALVLRDADGVPVRMIGVNWDITEQHEAQMALLTAKEATEAVYRAKSETLFILEQEIAERQRAEESLRVSEARLQDSAEKMQKMHQETQQHNIELQIWLEQEIREGREKDAILLQQDKMASIGQLSAGVAHEINNPMGFIMSNLGTLKEYVENLSQFATRLETMAVPKFDEQEQLRVQEWSQELDIAYIRREIGPLIMESTEGARRVKQIVLDLKDFARADEGDFNPADLNKCVQSTLNILRNEIKYIAEVNIQLEELPLVPCVAGQINQIIANLILNAAHAIEKHGTITIATRTEGDQVLLQVSDTGCGMTEEVLKHIFEPFFTTKKVGQGTGLGLSITHTIVKKHDGDISVQSEPGRGTTFTVRLPLHNRQKAMT